MQYKGFSFSARAADDQWVADIRRMDHDDLHVQGTPTPMFTTMKAPTSDDAVKLAAQAIDSGEVGPVDIA
jgi:uncharacterized ParB-like nuclease family protein